jgi:hypothetical protein
VVPLARTQLGATNTGTDRVQRYRYPVSPFGNNPDQPPMEQDGAETVYATLLDRPAVNIGVSILAETRGAVIDPWYLGSLDENTVQGFAGTPVDVNALTFDFLGDVGAAGASFPRQGPFYVAVDSGRTRFTDRTAAGRYILRAWVNDVTPPSLQLLTTRVSAGRPTLVFRTLDTQSGVDPGSLAIGYRGALVGASSFDRASGLAIFALPPQVSALRTGTVRAGMESSDYQEAKNIDTIGPSIMPNTRVLLTKLHVVAGAAVDWLLPTTGVCGQRRQELVVAASGPGGVSSVRFSVDSKRRAVVHKGIEGLWFTSVSLSKGTHTIVATATAAKGKIASARRTLRTCSG